MTDLLQSWTKSEVLSEVRGGTKASSNPKTMLFLVGLCLLAISLNAQHLQKPPISSSKNNDPVSNPRFPEVNIQYGKYGDTYRGARGFAYPACTDKIVLNNTATALSPNSIGSCGEFKDCAVYCFDKDNKVRSVVLSLQKTKKIFFFFSPSS